jgi:large subunit ribosomal protein L15
VSELNLSNLKPAQSKRDRKRIGRGQGSGKGRYSGRGIKGQKSRSGSKKMRAGFEGGQMPINMRVGKQRGSTSKDAMPVGPFRTVTYAVNVRDLEKRFDGGADVTVAAMLAAGLVKNTRYDVKILGQGDLTKKLSVSAHNFSKGAKEKIEAAGGTVTWLRGEPKPKHPRRRKTTPKPSATEEPVEDTPAEEATPEAEAAPAEEAED